MDPFHVYDAIAQAVAAEGIDTVYAVMGDGNMPWLSAFRRDLEGTVIHARHEAGAVSMADGHARVTGGIAVCSTTQGPGLTNGVTALGVAAWHRTPIVMVTGELPLRRTKDKSGQIYQRADQSLLVGSIGGQYRSVRDPSNVDQDLAWAFRTADRMQCPVVLGVPTDVMRTPLPSAWRYRPLRERGGTPDLSPPELADESIEHLADMLLRAERPIIIAGRGARKAKATDVLVALAEATGAGLATTIRAKGLFEGHPHDLGIAGGYVDPRYRSAFEASDLLVMFGSSMSAHTLDWGDLAPEATVVHVDLVPAAADISIMLPDLFVHGDLMEVSRRLLMVIDAGPEHGGRSPRGAWLSRDSPSSGAHPAEDGVEVSSASVVHPQAAMEAVNETLPKEWTVVTGIGHFWWYPLQYMTGRSPDSYIFAYDFGCIGQTLPIALGACVAAGSQEPVAVIEGDVGLMMNIQELETAVRCGVPITVLVMNDGSSGAEAHRMRAEGFDYAQVQFGRPDFAALASAVGGHGWRATSQDELRAALHEVVSDRQGLNLIDIHIDEAVASPIILKYLGKS